MEDMAEDGGQSQVVEEIVGRRWCLQNWCRCNGITSSNGEMGRHHGDEGEREGERERKREKKKNKKETKGGRSKMVVAGVMGPLVVPLSVVI